MTREDTKVHKADVAQKTKLPTSLMPNDIVAFMTEDELLDVVEYLLTLKTAVLGVDYWNIAGPFDKGAGDKGLDDVFPPEKGVDPKATYPGKLGPVGWRTPPREGRGGALDGLPGPKD